MEVNSRKIYQIGSNVNQIRACRVRDAHSLLLVFLPEEALLFEMVRDLGGGFCTNEGV